MSQVNSTPGKNEAAANKVVSAAVNETGVTDAKAKAAAKAVTYAQRSPGRTYDPLRS